VDPIERVSALFAESAQMNVAAAGAQAAPIALAAQCIVDSLLGGGKVLCCGNGSSGIDAQYFALQMQHRFQRERPGLPAIALNADAALVSAIALDEGFVEVFAKQVGALGHPGDVLLAISIDGQAGNVCAALNAAKERQMQIIVLSSGDGGEMAAHLRPADIEIRAPAMGAARILENHRLVIHCLCDLIDLQLMGG
jgi:D-sedoheptulose 7-phosphate isomerase